MTVTIAPVRYRIEHRPPGARAFRVVATCGCRQIAATVMLGMSAGRVGDWRIKAIEGNAPPGAGGGATVGRKE